MTYRSTALILGVGGQDGTLLARHLMASGRQVVGTVRPRRGLDRAAYLHGVDVVQHDVQDTPGFTQLLQVYRPSEVFNLAGFTSVAASWSDPDGVMAVNGDAVDALLEAMLRYRDATGAAPRFFQASSSEVFGPGRVEAYDESSPHDPRNPYGRSKSRAHRSTQRAREVEGLHASVGILFNHESPLRGAGYVTGKITRAAAEIAAGVRPDVRLGNLDVSRDWGWADDYVAAMAAMVSHDQPADYVLATGRRHTLADLLERAFSDAGLDDPWSYVVHDPGLVRPVDGPGPIGDPGRAERDLGWRRAVDFDEMVRHMVAADIVRVRTGIEESSAYLPPSCVVAQGR